jgi:hypothetical protein
VSTRSAHAKGALIAVVIARALAQRRGATALPVPIMFVNHRGWTVGSEYTPQSDDIAGSTQSRSTSLHRSRFRS